MGHTKLGSSFAINSYIGPVIRPIHFPRLPQPEYGLDCKGHTRLAYAYRLILAIMRYPWWRMEVGIDAVATPVGKDAAVSGLGMFLDDLAKLPYGSARFHQLDRLIQAFPRRFDYSD